MGAITVMLRETINQIAIERGRPNYPTDEDIAQAQQIVTNDALTRARNGLEPRKPFPFPNDYGYDIECYPNIFTLSVTHAMTGKRWMFEVSEWVDDSKAMFQFLTSLAHYKCRMVGYNNNHYDYTLIHLILDSSGIITYHDLYARSQAIFADKSGWAFHVWDNQRYIAQLDLFKMHHFDNKGVSLKQLEFNMRSYNIKDLPFPVGKPIREEDRLGLRIYNDHDVDETLKFYFESLPMIEFRALLNETYHGTNFDNMNDGKIGESYFARGLKKAGIPIKDQNGKRTTPREFIDINEIILPYIQFESPEFKALLAQMRTERIYNTKGANSWTATINGFDYDLGLGGIHASVKKQMIRSCDKFNIKDLDFASWYPHLSFNNNIYPEHLTPAFCPIYKDIYTERKKHPKGSALNMGMKFALNIPYGNSNSEFSFFYDPKFTMSITINGQLILCMLAEQLLKIPELTMIQCNTDGLTIKYPRIYENQVKAVWEWIEKVTGIELEGADYSMMAIRDVNCYVAKYAESGKTKHVGDYCYDTSDRVSGIAWHQDHSALVVKKAACAALLDGTPIAEFIRNHEDEYDFMLSTKVPRSSRLEMHTDIMWGDHLVSTSVETIQNISRYYVSDTGGSLKKVMPPTDAQIEKWNTGDHYKHSVSGVHKLVGKGKKPPSGMYELIAKPSDTPPDRVISIQSGYLVTDCSNMDDYYKDGAAGINYNYYINATRKLVDEVLLSES